MPSVFENSVWALGDTAGPVSGDTDEGSDVLLT